MYGWIHINIHHQPLSTIHERSQKSPVWSWQKQPISTGPRHGASQHATPSNAASSVPRNTRVEDLKKVLQHWSVMISDSIFPCVSIFFPTVGDSDDQWLYISIDFQRLVIILICDNTPSSCITKWQIKCLLPLKHHLPQLTFRFVDGATVVGPAPAPSSRWPRSSARSFLEAVMDQHGPTRNVDFIQQNGCIDHKSDG